MLPMRLCTVIDSAMPVDDFYTAGVLNLITMKLSHLIVLAFVTYVHGLEKRACDWRVMSLNSETVR